MDVVVALLHILIGLLFLTSGIAKALDLTRFTASVAEYKLIPSNMSAPIAYALVSLELTTGVLLLVGLFTTIATLIAIMLLAVFSTAVAMNLLRGRTQIDCGCLGGLSEQYLSWSIVARNVAVALLASATLIPVFSSSTEFLLASARPRPDLWPQFVQLVPLPIAVYLLYLAYIQWWVFRAIPPPYQMHPDDQ